MKKIEIKFLDSYKELDILCGKMFNVKTGVSEYIATMEKCQNAGAEKIPNWHNDYKSIKHLRWIRNKIAHEEESPCTKEDLKELKKIIKLVKKEKDPISQLYFTKNKKAKTARSLYKVSATCFYLAAVANYVAAIFYFTGANRSMGATFVCIGSAMLCVAVLQIKSSKNKK